MTGDRNLHIGVVSKSTTDITDPATRIGGLGIGLREEVLVKNEYSNPASVLD